MAKITEYPVTTEIANDDVLLVDGTGGTRGLSVSGFSEAVANNIVDSTAITGLVADIKADIQDTGDEVIASIPQDYTALQGEVSDLKSDLSDGAYLYSGNLLDFGYIGNTWIQGGSLTDSTALYKCRTKPITAVAGDKIYGVINDAKYKETFSYPNMALWVAAYNSANEEIGNKLLSSNTYQQTNDYELPEGTAFIVFSLSSGTWGNNFTPEQLDNSVVAFAYAGYDYISSSQVVPNYVSANTRIATIDNDLLSVAWNKKIAITNYGKWRLGNYDGTGTYISNTYRVCCVDHLSTTAQITLKIASGYRVGFQTFNNGVFSGYDSGWQVDEITIPENTEFVITIAKVTEDFAVADIPTFTNAVNVLMCTPDEESALAKRLITRIYDKDDSGSFFGFKSAEYVARNTTENWQVNSYTDDLVFNLAPNTLITIGCIARHGLGNQFAIITFFRSDDTQIAYYPALKTNTIVNSQGGFIKTWASPAGTAYAKVQFQTISNAQASGESSVIGENYYTKYGFAYIGSLYEENYSYMGADWVDAIETIKTEQGDKFVIGVQTDTHYYNGCSNAIGRNLSEFTKLVGVDCIANLGDIIQGYDDPVIDTPENSKSSMTEIVQRYCNDAKSPVMLLLGNHDSNSMYVAQHGGTEFSFNELYARIVKPSINTNPKAVIENGKFYYYTDFPALRLIVLNTNDGQTPHNFAVSSEQITWFKTVALNTTKPVLILSHVCLAQGVSQNYDASYAEIVDALVEFKNNNGVVVACINGHEHSQSSTVSNDILFIICGASIGFAGENNAEIITVDTTNRTIKTYGFGTLTSRTFTF